MPVVSLGAMTKTLQELIDASIFISTEYQAVLAELSQGADWDVDFSAPSFTLQTTPPLTLTPYLLGTESAARGSWIWSWQELGHFNPEVVSAAVQAKEAGQRLEVSELTTDEQPLQDGLARRLTLAAKAVTGLYAHYPARAGGNITAWLLLEGEAFELPRLSEQRMMQVIGESLTTDTAVDHNLAVNSYAALRGAHVEWDTDATCVVTVHDGAQRFWFDDHQITGVEPAEPSVGPEELEDLERRAETHREALREDRQVAMKLAVQLGELQRAEAEEKNEREREAAENERREREAAKAASAPEEEPLPEELSTEDISAPEPEQPEDDVAVAASELRDGDRPFDQEPTREPAVPGRVQTTVLPDPEEVPEPTAGPEASPQPNTTTIGRIPEPDLAASQPGVSREEEPAVVDRDERAVRDETRIADARGEREHDTAARRETVAGPGAAEDISAPAVVDGEEVETNEQLEKKGEKKKGFFSRFFGV